MFYLTTHSTHIIQYHIALRHTRFQITALTSWWEREMFYLMTHSKHFIYGYMASDIWLRTILIVRKETRCRHIGYSYRLTARVILYAPSHRQDNTYHSLCYTSRGALAGTRNSSMGPPHEGSIRRPIAPWANALPLSYVLLLRSWWRRRAKSSVSGLVVTGFATWHRLKSKIYFYGPLGRATTPVFFLTNR